MRKIVSTKILASLSIVLFLVGCGTNPVTGKRELSFYSTASQIQMGEQNYSPSQQSQGGVYYLDDDLNAYVSEVTQKLAIAAQTVFPEAPDLPYEIAVLDNNVPNAWALPGGKMAINRGLLVELEDESELAAVLGHEIIHAAANHGAAQMSRNAVFGVGAAVVGIAASQSEYGNLINYGSQIGSAAWMASYGRDDELESDHYGMMLMVEAGYDPQGAVRLQETFVRMSGGQSSDFISGLFASHPPSQQRVDANRAFAEQLPPGGFVGRERYQNAIAQMTRDAEAYEAEEQAIAALNDGRYDVALSALDRAVKIQPDGGQFWELRGHAWQMKNNNTNAEKAFSTAIDKNPDYFQHWLARGILRKELGRDSAAQNDLEISYSLMPTSTTAYYMGELAESRGDQNTAIRFYQQAASSSSELGVAAKTKLVRYDLPSNPGNYIASGLLLTDRGEMVAAVRNDSGIPIRGVRVRLISKVNGASKDFLVRGSLDHGQQGTVATGIVGDPAGYAVQVIAATPI